MIQAMKNRRYLMINSDTLEQLKNASIEERISIIEMLAQSLKNDISKDATPQSESKIQSQRPSFGFMKDTGEILGDIIAPVLTENVWEVLQ
jgi:sortase (surface protein transpeptidase)